jgi:hypothetical protein
MGRANRLGSISIADDPQYLEEPFVRSTNWTVDPTQRLEPVPTQIVDEIAGHSRGDVPHYLPGRNDQLGRLLSTSAYPLRPVS